MLELQTTTLEDLESLFVFQTDEVSIQMAAFTPENPNDKDAYMTKWSKIVQNPDIFMESIFVEGKIVGSVIHFDMMGETNVSYWIERSQWGKGIATEALQQFLTHTNKRPLHARAAHDNIGSQRVLEKAGFKKIAKEQGYANARGQEIEEFVYLLE